MATSSSFFSKHGRLERHSLLLLICIIVVVAIGGLVEITPLFYLQSTIEKVGGMRPYTPLELAGRDIYIRDPLVPWNLRLEVSEKLPQG